jgi:hypothetical protein
MAQKFLDSVKYEMVKRSYRGFDGKEKGIFRIFYLKLP